MVESLDLWLDNETDNEMNDVTNNETNLKTWIIRMSTKKFWIFYL